MSSNDIIDTLCKLKFSSLEAKIYLTLIKGGEQSCYRIAKQIGISRSSVYAAAEQMYESGYILRRTENKQVYAAQSPDILFNELRDTFIEDSLTAQSEIKKLFENKQEDIFTNIKGLNAILASAKDLINSAEKEIYLNFDFDPSLFAEEFDKAAQRGVRIILFSFFPSQAPLNNVEFYSYNLSPQTGHKPHRIMLVKDYDIALTADRKSQSDEWFGTYTNNRLWVDIVSEHIHHDIYLLKLQNKQNSPILDSYTRLNTMVEKRK